MTLKKQITMSTNLRGQLGVKSGPLAPTSAKLTTQMLVVSHMENHYKKISKARPAIDNGLPKSMASSQKLRDKRTRKAVERYGSRPSSRLTHRVDSTEDIYDEGQWDDEPEDEEGRQAAEIMRTTLRVPLKANHNIAPGSMAATDGSRPQNASPYLSNMAATRTMRPRSATGSVRGLSTRLDNGALRPASARSTTSLASNTSAMSRVSRSSNAMKATYSGDVLSKHAASFTEPSKPFTPRTLRSNRQSSLQRYKYYTPPPQKTRGSKAGSVVSNGDVGMETMTMSMTQPRAKPRGKKAGGGGGDLGATETLTETMLMDMSLQSHAPRQASAGMKGIPPLDISMDKDHLSWVKEQATRAQIRAEHSAASGRPDSAGRAAKDGGSRQDGGDLGGTDTLRFTRTGSTVK